MVSSRRLLRALNASATAHGCPAELTLTATRDWATALFLGARYDVAVDLPAGEAAERWIAGLPDVELPMPGQFANDVQVIARERRGDRTALMIEAVVLED